MCEDFEQLAAQVRREQAADIGALVAYVEDQVDLSIEKINDTEIQLTKLLEDIKLFSRES